MVLKNIIIYVKRYLKQLYIVVIVTVLMFLYLYKTVSLFFSIVSLSNLFIIPYVLNAKLRNFKETVKLLFYIISIAILCVVVTVISIILFPFISLHEALIIALLALLFNSAAALIYLILFFLSFSKKLLFFYHAFMIILIQIVSFSYTLPISLFLLFILGIIHGLMHLIIIEKKVYFIYIIGLVLIVIMIYISFTLAHNIKVKDNAGLLQKDLLKFSFTDTIPLQNEYSFDGSLMYLFRTNAIQLLKGNTYSFYSKKNGFYNGNSRDLPFPVSLDNKRWYNFDYIMGKINRKTAEGILYEINFSNTNVVYNEPYEITKLQPPQNSYISGAIQFSSLINTYIPLNIQWKTLSEQEYVKYTAYELDSDFITFIENNIVEKDPFSIIFYYYKLFKKDYKYSLKGEDITTFVLTAKKGYCAHFATAYALILRYYGIPCRVVSGFKINPEFKVLDYYKIYDFNAHAWVEIYTDELGWIPIDPTSSILSEDEINPFLEPKNDDKEIIEFLLKNEQNFMPYTETMSNEIKTTNTLVNTIQNNKVISVFILVSIILLYILRYFLYYIILGLFPQGVKWLSLRLYRSMQIIVQKKYNLQSPTFEDMVEIMPKLRKRLTELSCIYYAIHFKPKPIRFLGFQFLINYYFCYFSIMFSK